MNFIQFISSIKLKDLRNILLATIAIFLVDLFLYYLVGFLKDVSFDNYIRITLDHTRAFIPIVLLAIAVSESLFPGEIKITAKSLLFTYFTLFVIAAIRNNVQYFIEIQVMWPGFWALTNQDKIYFGEILLSIPLLGTYFIGYATLLLFPLRNYYLKTIPEITEDEDDEESEMFTEID